MSTKTLRLRLFCAFGGEGESTLQRHVNSWLESAADQGIKVEKTEIAMCSVGCGTEIYQHLVVSIWYTTGRDARA